VNNRRVLVATIFVAVCLLAFALTFLLLKSEALAVAACAGLVGGTVLFVSPFAGVVMYLLFLYVRPQDYVPALMGKPFMLMIGAATLGMFVLHMMMRKRAIHLANAPQNWILLWFFAAIAMSSLATLYVPSVIESVIDFLPVVMMYLIIANVVVTKRELSFLLNMLVVLTLVLAAQGIVQYYTGTGIGGQETYKGRIQGVGIFSDPNDLGLALVMVLPYVFLRFFDSPKPWQKGLSLFSMLVLVYALYLTQSRGGLMSFGALLMLLFARRMGKVLGYGIGAFAMLALFVLGPRMSSISTEEASAYGRIEAWGTGIDLFEQRPLFGVGFGNFTEYHFRTAHNSFVLCATELGMFGLYAWCLLIYISIKNTGFMARALHARGEHELASHVDTIRLSLIAYCMGAYWLSRTYSELLFIMVALATAVTQMFVASSGEKYVLIERRDFVLGFLCAVGGWAFTKAFLFMAW
jgi:O-antigen ligase